MNSNELFELTMIYSKCNKNNTETAWKFGYHYRNLPEILHTFVYQMMRRLRTTGSFPKSGPRKNHLYIEGLQIDIIVYLLANSHTSNRKASAIME